MENKLIVRRRLLFTTIIATFMLCACAKENKTVADDVSVEEGSTATTEEAASEESSENDIVTECNSYDEFIEEIKKLMDRYEASSDFDLSGPSYSIICSIEYSADEFGYIQVDIDGDGVDELLLGTIGSEENSYDTCIDNMYTIRDGKVVPVFESEYRDYYQLYEDGVVEYVYNYPPKPYYGVEFYKYNAGNLELMEGINCEFEYADDGFHEHYYYYDNASQKRELTEKEYHEMRDELINRYRKQEMQLQLHLFKDKQ